MMRRFFTLLATLSLVMCVATCAMWVRSYWVADVALMPKAEWWRRYTIDSDLGLVIVSTEILRPPSDPPYWHRYPLDESITKRLRALRAGEIPWTGFAVHSNGVAGQMEMFSAPYWFFVLLMACLPAVWAYQRWAIGNRRAVAICPYCGYDLRAMPDRCPECGKVPARKKEISN